MQGPDDTPSCVVGIMVAHMYVARLRIDPGLISVPLWVRRWDAERGFWYERHPDGIAVQIRRVGSPLEALDVMKRKADTDSRGWRMLRALLPQDGTARWIRVTTCDSDSNSTGEQQHTVEVLHNPTRRSLSITSDDVDPIFVVKDVFELGGSDMDDHAIENLDGLLMRS